MGPIERTKDAKILWNAGRKEGAWAQALIAAAGTARKRYPLLSDTNSYTSYIRDVQVVLFTGDASKDFPGNSGKVNLGNRDNSIEFASMIYKQMRCSLLHEAELSKFVVLTESKTIDGKLVADFIVGKHKYEPTGVPDFFVLHLIAAVEAAPENKT